MKSLILIHALIFPLFCQSASIPSQKIPDQFDLTAESYTFIVATIYRSNEYPIILEALRPINDTLTVSLSDHNSFISSLYSTSKFVDDAHSWMTEYYELLWPGVNVIHALNEYKTRLTSALKHEARKYVFKTLNDQANITIEAINVSGIFMHLHGKSNYTGSSLGINPSEIPGINDIWVPIFIVDFSVPDELIIKLK